MNIYKTLPKEFLFFGVLFLIGLVTSTIRSSDLHLSIFGEYGRRSGLLTYLSLLIIFLLAFKFLSTKDSHAVITAFAVIGSYQSVSSLLQHYQVQPWAYSSDPLNMVGTLGNSNFMSAFVGISASIILLETLRIRNKVKQIARFGIIFIMIFAIVKSQSLQGLVVFALSVLLFIYLRLQKSNINRWLRRGWLLVSASILVMGFAGSVGKGPISNYIYQYSTTMRGDFFRAAIEMFLANPIFGVGLDAFGNFYLNYRDSIAASREGVTLLHTNYAHNEFLQLAATGGLTLLIPYFLINLYIARQIFSRIKKMKLENFDSQISEVIVYFIHFSMLLISTISLYEISTSIWRIVFIALVLRFITEEYGLVSTKVSPTIENILINSLVGVVLSTLLIINFLSPFWRADRALAAATRTISDTQDENFRRYVSENAYRAIQLQPNESRYWIESVKVIYNSGYHEKGKDLSNVALSKFPRNHYLFEIAAKIYEFEGLLVDEYKVRNLLKNLNLLSKINNDRLEQLKVEMARAE